MKDLALVSTVLLSSTCAFCAHCKVQRLQNIANGVIRFYGSVSAGDPFITHVFYNGEQNHISQAIKNLCIKTILFLCRQFVREFVSLVSIILEEVLSRRVFLPSERCISGLSEINEC